MNLIESLQQKSVEEVGDDTNECGEESDFEETEGGLAKEEGDSSLNEDEQGSAEDKKMESEIEDSDVNADGSVKTMAEIKEGDEQPNKKDKGDAEEEKDPMKNKTNATEVVDASVEEDAVEAIKGSKEVDINESQRPQKRKGDDTDIIGIYMAIKG